MGVKMKKLKLFAAVAALLSGITIGSNPIQAAQVESSVSMADKELIRQGDTVSVTVGFDSYTDVKEGINAVRGTLEYDESVFQQLDSADLTTVNDWESLRYNPDNGRFTAVKRSGGTEAEQILTIHFTAKEDVKAGDTRIAVTDLEVSEGNGDLHPAGSEVALAVVAYLFRNLMVKQKAMAQVPALIISGAAGVAMAWAGMSYWGIATQTLVYIALTNLAYWRLSSWRPTLQWDFHPLREMFGFSSRLLVTNLFTQVSNNLLSALLGRFFTPGAVGQYTQSAKWNTMGYSFVSGMISSVAQPVLTEASDARSHQLKVLRKMQRFAAFLSFPAMLGLALTAEELIVIAITDKWLPCVPILQTLCLWGAFVPIITLYTNLIISKGWSGIYMWNTIVLSLTQIVLLIVCHSHGIQVMVTCFVCVNIGWLSVWHHFVKRVVGLTLWMAAKDILPFALIALGTTLLAWYATQDIGNIYLRFIGKVAAGAAGYMAVMWFSRAKIFKDCISFIINRKNKQWRE